MQCSTKDEVKHSVENTLHKYEMQFGKQLYSYPGQSNFGPNQEVPLAEHLHVRDQAAGLRLIPKEPAGTTHPHRY